MSENNCFNIPVCLFTWKRFDTVKRIVDVLRKVNVKKLYIFSDYGRNEEEIALVEETRKKILEIIDWDCEIIKKFPMENQGVFKQIGLGAISVLENEEQAIFIEDDNLPNEDFFYYCEEALSKYKDEEKVYMICGTNYKSESNYDLEHDAYFVRALLPCGWASWSHKFSKYYLQDLSPFDDKTFRKQYIKKYFSKTLGKQELDSILAERKRFVEQGRYVSWDYHMIATVMLNDLVVLSPKVNLIRNIGIDEYSIHDVKKIGRKNPMTRRFCEVPTHDISHPIKLPDNIEINKKYQRYCEKTITFPLSLRIKRRLVKIRNKILRKK